MRFAYADPPCYGCDETQTNHNPGCLARREA